jgi:hypothetical protein
MLHSGEKFWRCEHSLASVSVSDRGVCNVCKEVRQGNGARAPFLCRTLYMVSASWGLSNILHGVDRIRKYVHMKYVP